ncbi:MAG TPA: hypothetical protein PLC52_06675 [Anaerolineales bacterium]|nr:hypothetical protein [Anaerolineales bacterium]HRQ92534.1 hypothetical protein [Anaerolineales bacterium]
MAGNAAMKVAFVAHRANYLKHYGPIIDAALARGWVVECWLQDVSLGDKEYLRITPVMITEKWGQRVIVRLFEQPSDVAALNAAHIPDAIISLHSRSTYMPAPGTERFITLQHSVDLFAVNTVEQLASSDYVCLYTPFWLDYAVEYYAAVNGATREQVLAPLEAKLAYTGFAQMDAFGLIDPDEVRTRWGIPQDKRVVLVLPLDLTGWPGLWPHFFQKTGLRQWYALWKARKERGFVSTYWQWALKGWNDARLAQAIKQFAERNNAIMLIKGREKDLFRPAWSEHAFGTYYDDKHYPSTVFEAIAIADLCVLFYSTAVQEAVYANVPALCIDRPNKDIVKHHLWRRADVGGPYHFPGAVSWMSIPEAIQTLPATDLGVFVNDTQAREDYLAKFNGPADHRACERILDLVTA